MLKIAIIDDGVNSDVFEKCKVNHEYIVKKNRISPMHKKMKVISHGTICASIIRQYANVDFELYSLIVKPVDGNGKLQNLINAINFCINNNINIANISIGTIDKNDRQKIMRVVKLANEKGVIMVAAISNDNEVTYPASLQSVIGVRHTEKAYLGLYYFKSEQSFTLGEYSKRSLEMKNGIIYNIDSCNSFATAFVTARIVKLLVEEEVSINFDDIKRIITRKCINTRL